MESITGFKNTENFTRSAYIKTFIENYPPQRFNDDNPSVYLWLEKEDSRISLIDKDDIIELKTGDYDNIVITNCGFLVFLKNSNIKAIYDLFEEKEIEGTLGWKSLEPDFSFFDNYNYITTPLNCRRIYIKEGKLDLDKVKKYTENGEKYYNINVDALSASKENPDEEGFFSNVLSESIIYFNLKPNFKISFFDNAGNTINTASEYVDIIGTATKHDKHDISLPQFISFTKYNSNSFYIECSSDSNYDIFYLELDFSRGAGKNFTGYIEVL